MGVSSSNEMQVLVNCILGIIDYWSNECMIRAKSGESDTSPQIRKDAYAMLGEKIKTEADLDNLRRIVKDICMGLVHSILDGFDEGFPSDSDGTTIHLDIVDARTGRSVITYAAHEEFFNCIPDEYEYFSYQPEDYDHNI